MPKRKCCEHPTRHANCAHGPKGVVAVSSQLSMFLISRYNAADDRIHWLCPKYHPFEWKELRIHQPMEFNDDQSSSDDELMEEDSPNDDDDNNDQTLKKKKTHQILRSSDQHSLLSFVPPTCPNSTIMDTHCNISQTPCATLMSCRNNSTCTNTTVPAYLCSCLPGFDGTRCEFDNRPCKPTTCWNNDLSLFSCNLDNIVLF